MSSQASLSQAAREAIDWAVRLQSHGVGALPDAALQTAFQGWLEKDADHAAAWARLQQRLEIPALVRAVDHRTVGQARQAREILLRPGRRMAVKTLLGLGVTLGGAAVLSHQARPWFQTQWADLRTGNGQRLQRQLADGSALVLNAASAVDVDFDASRRLLYLREGELQVQVAPEQARPFIVQTANGQVRALGTRFTVRLDAEAGRTWVAVQEHAVALTAAGRDDVSEGQLTLQEGQQAWMDAQGVHLAAEAVMVPDAWVQGRLSVLDAPLSDVIDRFRPYRAGFIRLDPAVAGLRVQGVFSLDDTDRSLRALADTLPIRVDYLTRWLVKVQAR